MLGTLSKWLRILGYDTLYDPALNDDQLVRIARAEGRVLLTRDLGLAERRGVRVLLVANEGLEDQIRQVMRDLQLVPDQSFSRCPVCNGALEVADRESVRAHLPAYVVQTHKSFRRCPGCDRIYWRGTHWQRMKQNLADFWPPTEPSQPADTVG